MSYTQNSFSTHFFPCRMKNCCLFSSVMLAKSPLLRCEVIVFPYVDACTGFPPFSKRYSGVLSSRIKSSMQWIRFAGTCQENTVFFIMSNPQSLTDNIQQIGGSIKGVVCPPVAFDPRFTGAVPSCSFLFLPSVKTISPVFLSTRPIRVHQARDYFFSLPQYDTE